MIFLLLALACGDGSGDDTAALATASDAPTWDGELRVLVEDNCASCHQAGGFGGFSLTTYDDAAGMAELMAAAVSDRRMPPWKAVPGCAEYEGDISLSEDEIQAFVDWSEAGAPQGDAADPAVPAVQESQLSRVDHTLPMPEPYLPEGIDDYRCFVIDWPLEQTTFVTGFDFEIGSPEVVHHIVAYLAPPGSLEDYQALDAADGTAGDGYTCFGGPGLESNEDAAWLGAWAPGAVAGDLPEGTGIYVEGGSDVVLQIHYNTEYAGAYWDQSSMRVSVADEVEHPGIIQPWANPLWLDSDLMLIPAGSEGVEHGFSYDLGGEYMIWTANVHMHELGRTGSLVIDRADGSQECMLQIDDWDFHWQRSYRFAEPKTIEAGDAVSLSCTWDNPTDEDIVWGDGTSDEMCLGTFLLTLP